MDENTVCHLYNRLVMEWGERYRFNSIKGAYNGLEGLIDSRGHGPTQDYIRRSFGIDIKPTLSGTRLKIEIELFTEDDY